MNGLQFDEEVDTVADPSSRKDGHISTDAPPTMEPAPKRRKVEVDQYMENFKRASAHYIVDGTRREYNRWVIHCERVWNVILNGGVHRQFQHFVNFCAEIGFVDSSEALVASFKAGIVPAETPTWVAFWIMKR